MKKLFLCLIIILGLFAYSGVFAAEKIDNYSVKITINEDASIDISEVINYDFAAGQKHGIFRDIPVKYKARGGNYNLRISDIFVGDESNNPYAFKEARIGNNIQIKIGDADKFVSGKKTYIIKYKINRAINFFDDHDELYWNAIGTEWFLDIGKPTVNVFLPEGSKTGDVQKECFIGRLGSTERCGTTSYNAKGSSIYFQSRSLKSGEGMTVVIGIPKGVIIPPATGEKLADIMKDNWILFLPLVTLAALSYLWRKKGKDPKGRGTIIAQYDAPDNLTPAEAGTIIDEKAHNKDVSAEIIYLATRGYIKIAKIKDKGIIFKSDNYRFDKLMDGNNLSNSFQKKLMKGLFGGKSSVKLDELKDKFYKDLEKVIKGIYSSVTSKGYFPKSPRKTRAIYIGIGIAALVLSLFIGPILGVFGVFSAVSSAIIIFIFGFFMPVRTLKGVHAKEHILGLKEYLSVAEKDRIKFHNAPEKNPEQFEKLLPYAMVLGVEKEWAKQFEGIYDREPSWYSDPSGTKFSSLILANSLGNFSSSANANLSSHPSSASSGGSGFSGGGGGGFGGGGGGSW